MKACQSRMTKFLEVPQLVLGSETYNVTATHCWYLKASFDLRAPPAQVQKGVGQRTSGMCIEIRPDAHRPSHFYTGEGDAGR